LPSGRSDCGAECGSGRLRHFGHAGPPIDFHECQCGVPPQTRWESDGFLPRLPDSLEQLDLLLLTVAKPRRVHQDGIHFQGFRHIDLTLAAYVGEDVTIRYDPRDMAEVRVYFGGPSPTEWCRSGARSRCS
jgi:Mu transposase, C-terminal